MPTDRRDLHRQLLRLASTQSGHFTASQSTGIGYSYQAQKYHTDRGNWVRVDRALYRLPEWPVGQHDDLVRWSLWSAGIAVVSHDTALAVHDLGDANPAHVHLTVPPGFKRRAPGVVLHPGVLPPTDIRQHEGFRITTPVRTLFDVAAGHMDLDQLATAVGDACRQGSTTPALLLRRAEEHGDRVALRIERALRLGGLL